MQPQEALDCFLRTKMDVLVLGDWVVEHDDGNTYRAVYTVRFKNAVYVLHCFQKKSHKGISTPKHEMDIVEGRLKLAKQHSEGAGS